MNRKNHSPIFTKYIALFVVVVSGLFGFYLISRSNYLLFHSLAEGFSIVVAGGIFMVFWNSRRYLDNSYYLFVGIAYLFVATMDFIHTLAYTGMGVFPGTDANLATQLWVATRYLESLSLLAAPLFIHRRLKSGFVFAGYLIVVSLSLASIFYWNVFPDCFVEGRGLTPFKKISEYLISLFLVTSIVLVFQKREKFDARVLQLLVASIGVTVASELAFTLYVHVYGLSNFFGHIFKIVSFYLIYKAFIEAGLTRPHDLIFRELKQKEQELRESEERFAGLYHSSKDAIGWAGPDGTLFEVNDAFCRLTGYSKDELLAGTRYQDMTPEEYDEWEAEIVGRVLRTGEPAEYEKEYIGKDGSRIPILLTVFIVRGADGEPLGVAAIIKDITERVRAEAALREREEFPRTVVEASLDAIVAVNERGQVLLFNSAAEELFQYSAEEVIGAPVKILLRDSAADIHQVRLEKFLGRGIGRCGHIGRRLERIFQRKDGTTFTAEIAMSGGRSNGLRLVVVSIHDITERKRVEEHVAYQAHLLANVNDAIIATDDRFIVTAWNRAAEEIHGWKAEEAIGRLVQEVIPSHLTAAQRTEALRTLAEDGRYRVEVDMVRKDGQNIYVEGTTVALRGEDGRITGYVSVNRDITERKRAEEALRRERDRTQQYFDIAGVMLVAIDTQGQVILANRKTCEVLGYEEQEVLGKNWFENFIPLRIREELFLVSHMLLSGDVKGAEYYENPILTRAGEERLILWHNTVIRDEAGHIVGHLSSGEDITERVRADQEREHLLKRISLGRERLQMLSKRLLLVHEAERRSIAIELHDRIGQDLTALKLHLQSAQRLRDIPAFKQYMNQGIDSLTHLSQRVRELALDLRPSILDDLGLVAALRWYIDRQMQDVGVRVEYHLETLAARPDAGTETACFRVAQEALTNILRHAQATVVRISLRADEGSLRLVIQDDGIGFDSAEAYERALHGESMGLLGMRERVELTGGELRIDSAPGRGATLEACFPLASSRSLERRENGRDSQ